VPAAEWAAEWTTKSAPTLSQKLQALLNRGAFFLGGAGAFHFAAAGTVHATVTVAYFSPPRIVSGMRTSSKPGRIPMTS
jgi:hypothetical protein